MGSKKGAVETRGEKLKRLRRAKGLSLEQVHKKTKIHIRILRALEEDAVVEMSEAYVKGLLKIYCALLGISPNDLMEEYRKDKPLEEKDLKVEFFKKEELDSHQAEERLSLPKPHISISLIKKQVRLKQIIFVIGLLFLAMVAFRLGKNFIYRESRIIQKAPPVTVASYEPEVSSAAGTVINPRLDIRAKEDCWLQVKVDGRTVFKGILKKGHFEYWQAKKRIEFSLGNAGGVDVELNGKQISPLGRRGQIIRNIIITKEGLKVPR